MSWSKRTAVTHPRPYRDGITPYWGMTTLLTEANNGGLDTEYVRIFVNCFTLFPIGSFVPLSNGMVPRVIRSNGDENTRPVVVPIDPSEQMAYKEIDLCTGLSLSIVEALSESDALARANLCQSSSD